LLPVLTIAQDHQGYLWLATRNGLVRYDGYSLKSSSTLTRPSDQWVLFYEFY
jgi:ligand-binding sensor domain-containing protein